MTDFNALLGALVWVIRSGGSYSSERARVVAKYVSVCAARDMLNRMVDECTAELAAERQRAEGLQAVLRDLVKWLDDHDWGYVPEPGESCIPFRALLAKHTAPSAPDRAKPDAWILRTGHGDYVSLHIPKCEIPEAWKPLYAHPPKERE